MPDITVNIEIYCGKCGAGLCHNSTFVKTRMRDEPSFRIEPCEKCLETARDEGYENGRQEGYQVAQDEFQEG